MPGGNNSQIQVDVNLDKKLTHHEKPSTTPVENGCPAPRTPLPKVQLITLMLIQLGEPVISNVIFPFVNQFVRDTGITGGDDRKTGYFGGAIESAFYATEAMCVLSWGRASDHAGRKPILLSGLLGLTLSTVGFGLSRQFWSALLARCAQGALCGNIGVAKSMLAEMTDSSNIAEAFSFLPMVWTLGGTLAPLIGGLLARPAQRWPHTIGKFAFFRDHPYILPCIVAACVPMLAFVAGLIILKETLPSRKIEREMHEEKAHDQRNPELELQVLADGSTTRPTGSTIGSLMDVECLGINGPSSTANVIEQQLKRPTIRVLLVRRIVTAIVNYALLAFFDQCMTILLPLMYSTPLSFGGLGFSTFTIGIILGAWGVSNGLFSIIAFPRLLRAFGVKRLYIVSSASSLLCVATFPVMSYLAKHSESVNTRIWPILIIQLALYILSYMGYGIIFVFINQGAPANARGTLNGLAQMTVSLMRALAPSTAASLFAVSLERNIAGGNLVYIVLGIMTVASICASFQLPN